MKERQALTALSAVAQETRMRLLRRLIKAGEAGESAGRLGQAVKASPSSVSFHLSTLEHAGLVTSARHSRQIIYQADFKRIGALMRYLLLDCCRDDPRITSCCGFPSREQASTTRE